MSRVRGNNQEDSGPVDMEALEDRIKNAMYTVGKEKMIELLIETFPEIGQDEDEEEQLEVVEQVMEEDRAILEQLDD